MDTEHRVLTHVHTRVSFRLLEWRECGGSAGESSGGPRHRHTEDAELVRDPEVGRRLTCDRRKNNVVGYVAARGAALTHEAIH